MKTEILLELATRWEQRTYTYDEVLEIDGDPRRVTLDVLVFILSPRKA